MTRERVWLVGAALVLLLAIVAVQAGTGAYQAEFTAHADEPAHFVTALMVYDYVTTRPAGSPFEWAADYYLHYPKVGLGHWPPAFYAALAAWWLATGPSRAAALVLLCLLAWAAAVLVYRQIAPRAGPVVALVAGLLLLLSPPVQLSYTAVMSDLPVMLLAIVLLPSVPNRPWMVVLYAVLALATKGTAIPLALLAVAVVAYGAIRKAQRPPLRWVMAVLVVMAVGIWLFSRLPFDRDLAGWAGLDFKQPWPVLTPVELAGPGIAVLGIAGALLAWRQPAAALVAAAVITSFFIRAMREPRHWILILPAVLVLASEAYRLLSTRWRWAPVVAIPCLLLFPWQFSKQLPFGYGEMAKLVKTPSRMLIGSTATGEGAWIAAVALQERRPGSVVMRASQVFPGIAAPDLNRGPILPRIVATVEHRLDAYGVERVVLADKPATRLLPLYMRAIRTAVSNNRAWAECGNGGALTVYCRQTAPKVPREPLRLNLRDQLGRDLEEPLPR